MSTKTDADTSGRVPWERVRFIAVPAALVLVALALRLPGLDVPDRMYFDEVYYAEDALALLEQGVEDGFAVHPPVGKWLIAAGIATVGFDPVGWRVAAAIAGALTVLATYGIGIRLFGRLWLAALAGLLVAVDGMALSISRIAMLDGFVAMFVSGAAWLLLVDREQRADSLTAWPPPGRWAAGALLGLAVATKWSAVLAVGAAGLVVLAWELADRRRAGAGLLADPGRLAAGLVLPFVVLPAMVYLASYTGWFLNYPETRPGSEVCDVEPCPVPLTQQAADWWHEQGEIVSFHTDLDAEHDYRAPAWTWPILTRPVVHYFESCGREEPADECEVAPGHGAIIVGVGNPAVWWLALPAYGLLGWAGIARRRSEAGFLLVFLLAQWVPWLVTARPVFFFYTAPLVPFVALTLAWASGEVAGRWRRWRWLPAVVAVAAIAAAVYLYPVWVGAELSGEGWRDRMLLRSWY